MCHRYPRIFRVVISSTRRRRSSFAISSQFRSLEPPSFHSSSLSPAPSLHFAHCPPRHRLAPRRRRRPSSRTTIVSQRPEKADGSFRAAGIIWPATSCRRRAPGDEASRRPTSSSRMPHPGPS